MEDTDLNGAPAQEHAEHPAARRMRERFEAKYGSLADVMRAANGWRTTYMNWQRPYNMQMQEPVTEDDVEAAEGAMLDAVRALLDKPQRALPDQAAGVLSHLRKHYKVVPVDAPPDTCDRKGCVSGCCSDPCAWVRDVAEAEASWREFDRLQDSSSAQGESATTGEHDDQ